MTMASKVVVKTTFEQVRAIEPFYTGGEIVADSTGNFAACTIDDEDCLILGLGEFAPLCRIEGDGEAITSLAITVNATHVIVCSRSLSVKIYQLTHEDKKVTATLTRTLKPHTTPVVACTTDSTGSLLATGGAEGIVKVWDVQGGYCSHTFHSHGGVVTALCFIENLSLSRKGSGANKSKHAAINGESKSLILASSGEDGKIKVHGLNSRQQLATLDSHVSVVRSLAFSSQAQYLLSASRDRTLVIWDVQHWKAKKIITATEELEAAGFLPNGQTIYAGGESGRVRVFRLDGSELLTTDGSNSSAENVTAILSIPSKYSLVAVRNDQTLELLSFQNMEARVRAGEPVLVATQLHSGNHDEVIDVAYINDSLLAISDNTEIVKILSTATSDLGGFGNSADALQGHSDVVICMDVDPHGRWLVTGSKDNTARIWYRAQDASRFDCYASLAGHTASIGAVSLHKTHDKYRTPQFLITGSEDKTIKKWDLSKLKEDLPRDGEFAVKASFTRVAHEKDINAVDVSSATPIFASASQDRTIKIWSIEDGSTAAVLKGHKRGVWSVKFSPNGTPALTLAEGGSSGNRGLLVSGSGDNTVKVWSMNTYTCLLTFEGHQNSVLKVLWVQPQETPGHDDAQKQQKQKPMIASASSDTLIKLWSPYDSADGDHLLTTIDGHSDRVWSLATPSTSSPSVPYNLISGAADAKVVFWADTTAETTTQSSKERNDRVEQDQLLQNHIFAKNYKEVVTLALALNHPGRLLRVFEDVVNLPIDEKDEGSFTGLTAMDEVLANLNQKQVFQILERLRDWNTNGRTATVSQKILNCLLRTFPAEFWLDMAQDREILKLARAGSRGKAVAGGNAMKDLFRALEAYTDRHFKRMEDLSDETYLLEYTLREMDEVSTTVRAIGETGQDTVMT